MLKGATTSAPRPRASSAPHLEGSIKLLSPQTDQPIGLTNTRTCPGSPAPDPAHPKAPAVHSRGTDALIGDPFRMMELFAPPTELLFDPCWKVTVFHPALTRAPSTEYPPRLLLPIAEPRNLQASHYSARPATNLTGRDLAIPEADRILYIHTVCELSLLSCCSVTSCASPGFGNSAL